MKKIYLLLFFIATSFAFAQSPIPAGAVVEKLRTGFLQPEGPVWKDGIGLLFSDIKANKIYSWSPVDSVLTTYLYPSDSSNGLTLDHQGRLILTQMAKRRVSRQEMDGSITVLASTYLGKKFNSPNDLVVKSDGSIFFTDPNFNPPNDGNPGMFINGKVIRGIYRISPIGDVQLLDGSLDKPNGICFSLDEKKLYVCESPKDSVYVWDVVNDTTLANRQPFYKIPVNGYADGMKIDPSGNLYFTGPYGVWIVTSAGVYLDKITMTETPSNCAWGGADRKTLYMTAGYSLYRIRLSTTGIKKDHGHNLPDDFQLYQNYPNPFNPTKIIKYDIPNVGTRFIVSMKIYDILGREAATLVNETKEAGSYEVQFNASRLASSVYFYRIQAGSFVEAKKLMLMK